MWTLVFENLSLNPGDLVPSKLAMPGILGILDSDLYNGILEMLDLDISFHRDILEILDPEPFACRRILGILHPAFLFHRGILEILDIDYVILT